MSLWIETGNPSRRRLTNWEGGGEGAKPPNPELYMGDKAGKKST